MHKNYCELSFMVTTSIIQRKNYFEIQPVTFHSRQSMAVA
jgi:hypothetical protein